MPAEGVVGPVSLSNGAFYLSGKYVECAEVYYAAVVMAQPVFEVSHNYFYTTSHNQKKLDLGVAANMDTYNVQVLNLYFQL